MSEVNSKPPIEYKRNEYGLLNHINHVFNEDGTVNWRKMIKPEHLVLNKSKKEELEKIYQKPFAEILPSEVKEDEYLLILLIGIRFLASIRGFLSVDYRVISSTPEYASVVCTVRWIANYENEPKYSDHCDFSALADASPLNTFNFAKNYPMAIAENRAFVRAVRNFLRIHIVGSDEIDPSDKSLEGEAPEGANAYKFLQDTLHDKGKDFESFKNELIRKGIPGAEKWEKITDIPKDKVFEFISIIKKKEVKKE